MTDPTGGKFATQDDVTSRFEGDFPSNRLAWVVKRIIDVEDELMFQVPSLRKDAAAIDAESEAAGDPDRRQRVVRLVADKVLDLYRHPDGANQLTRTMPDITVSRTFGADPTRGRVQFTSDELDRVRLHTRRTKFGTITIQPPPYSIRP
ncbi:MULTISPECIES: hypothetical protein [unclassified Mycobacterium]|uniref:hypothetical protein n=1 Tax=unclassified Mycobacterium TaxID=2642494 RepID=UPI00274127C1|nr:MULTISPECIES: hypothetical protein [unclassified Mycobacterium]MDP7703184.1 hypothetical protein [Mycobacterium sp. TY815]MDP7721789.1 hypothetical protein [Mycobacterium sp. TY814]